MTNHRVKNILTTFLKRLDAGVGNVIELINELPYQRIVTTRCKREEIFDLYQLGLFHCGNDQHNGTIVQAHAQYNQTEIMELVGLQPHAQYSRHYHKNSAAVIYIISGLGTFLCGDALIRYHPGMRMTIPAGMLHGFNTQSRTFFLSIQTPPIIHPESGEIDLHYPEGE
ncbi:hypothetical protein AQUSIP_11350 [Aquicella siphonis]|uniref:Cupin type-2 domain-containing protein n=1 Tax=Aquicella siphonis TaxID=254247 RepID=A0A5E4PH53_9COXI|nr:cupin domain-containing protein [Aquicella siphonis]VVC75838.1 hypothetical protein AQUSIP_11350 [Aquicella siphonis]